MEYLCQSEWVAFWAGSNWPVGKQYLDCGEICVSNTTSSPYAVSTITFDDITFVRVFDIVRDPATYLRPSLDTVQFLVPYYEEKVYSGESWNTVGATGVHTLNTLLPRYTSGAGVQVFMWANNATPLGAGTPSLILTATNSAQSANRVTPLVYPVGKTAAANGLILYTGTGVGKYGPFIPQAGGDAGIAQIDSFQISSTYTSGEFSIGLCVPILTMPITTLGVASERDLINQVPSLPRIYDGANLQWLIYNGAATPINSAIAGHLDFAWG